jgi:hypothetical protein
VVHQGRGADGRRRVESVAEVVLLGDAAGTRELFGLRHGEPWLREPRGTELARRLEAAA